MHNRPQKATLSQEELKLRFEEVAAKRGQTRLERDKLEFEKKKYEDERKEWRRYQARIVVITTIYAILVGLTYANPFFDELLTSGLKCVLAALLISVITSRKQ